MAKNVLYNVITDTTSIEGNIPRGITLISRKYKDKTPYFIFELPKPARVLGDFILDHHHISIFEESEGRERKSQYHYTAYLKDNNGNSFRLHIYFNSKDGYADVPILEKISDNGTKFTRINSEEHYEAFKAFAHVSIDALVAQLRKDQKNLVIPLKEDYDLLEKEGTELSIDPIGNKDKYKANIEKQIKKLEQLKTYCNADDPILDNLSYLKKLKQSPELRTTPSALIPLESKEHKRNTITEDSSSDVPKEVASGTVKEKTELEDETSASIIALKEQFKKFSLLSKDSDIIDLIGSIHANLVKLELGINDDTPLKDLHELNPLRKILDTKASKILGNLLMGGKYTEVASLASFYRLIPDSMIRLAIVQNNFKLLDFLFKNKLIPLPYSNFTIKDQQYRSIAEYYFKQASATDVPLKLAAIINCVDVLVKNGQFLMEIESSTSLPYVSSLVTQVNHPLRQVLNRNNELTFNNTMFYRQLIQVLRVTLAQPSCPEKSKADIPVAIEYYKLQILKLNNLNNPLIGISIEDLENQYTKHVKETLRLDLEKYLEGDLELIKLKIQVEQRLATVHPKLTGPLTQIDSCLKEDLDDLKKVISAMKQSGKIPALVHFRTHLTQYHRCTLKDLELVGDMSDIKKRLTKKRRNFVRHNDRASEMVELSDMGVGYEETLKNKESFDKALQVLINTGELVDTVVNRDPARAMEQCIARLEAKKSEEHKSPKGKGMVDLKSNFFGSLASAKESVSAAPALKII